jgi:hypothetical protein
VLLRSFLRIMDELNQLLMIAVSGFADSAREETHTSPNARHHLDSRRIAAGIADRQGKYDSQAGVKREMRAGCHTSALRHVMSHE